MMMMGNDFWQCVFSKKRSRFEKNSLFPPRVDPFLLSKADHGFSATYDKKAEWVSKKKTREERKHQGRKREREKQQQQPFPPQLRPLPPSSFYLRTSLPGATSVTLPPPPPPCGCCSKSATI